MMGIREYKYSKRVSWFLWCLLVIAMIVDLVVTISAWQGWGCFSAAFGVSLLPFLVPSLLAEFIMFNIPVESSFKRNTSHFAWIIAFVSALVCNAFWYWHWISNVGFWITLWPLCIIVIPIVLWIAVKVISECDKNRNNLGPEKEDNRTPEQKKKDLKELFS